MGAARPDSAPTTLLEIKQRRRSAKRYAASNEDPRSHSSSAVLPSGQLRSAAVGLDSCGFGNVDSVHSTWRPVDRSLRRLGQLLVVMGALFGAVLGVSLALLVEDAETSRAVAAPGRERAAVLAASPPSSQPRASRAASSQDAADGRDSSGTQSAEAADRANQRAGKGNKKGESRGDKAGGRGKKKPGKGNSK
jgi:hypothetical protein